MTVLWTLVVPRALGPTGMGLIVSGWAVAGVLGIVLGLGTRTYLVRELIVNPASSGRLIGTAIALRLLMAPVFLAAVVLYTHTAGYSAEGNLVIYLAAGATFVTLLAEPMQAGFQAIQRMEYLAYSEVISKSAQGVLGIALALIGFRSVGITACWLVVSGVVLVADVVWLRRFVVVDVHARLGQVGQMARASAAYWAFGIFFMAYLWIDAVMLSLMTRPEVVGWYGVPTKLFQSLMFLPVIVSTAWLPRLISAAEESPEKLRQAARAPLELVLMVSLPLAAMTAVVASPAIGLLYGSAYDKAAPVLVVLGLCLPPMYLNILLSQVLVAAKRQVQWTWVMAGATVINPLLNYALITVTDDRYGNGALGAAIALLLTEILVVSVGFVVVGSTVLNRPAMQRCARAALASAAGWGAGYATAPRGPVFSIAAATAVIVLGVGLLRVVSTEQREAVRTVLRRGHTAPVPD
jgi:O-antigen/teichoic acid export membrane protein